jgi:hypothetical protein
VRSPAAARRGNGWLDPHPHTPVGVCGCVKLAARLWFATRMPVVHAPEPSRVGQHGLELVMAICPHFEVHREPVGKRVMAAVMVADDAVGDMAGRLG